MLKSTGAVAVSLALLAFVNLPADAADGFKKRIMVFGDSNTYGWIPANSIPSARYSDGSRWTDVLQAQLGDDYEVIDEGLSGRTTDQPDSSFIKGAGFDGAAYLPPAIASHLPLDAVVIMLGTNDLKPAYGRSPLRIALGVGVLADIAKNTNENVGTNYPQPRVLLICPPALDGAVDESALFKEMYAGSLAKSKELPAYIAAIAGVAGVDYLDANEVVSSDGADGLHFTQEGHLSLGKAVADKLNAMLAR